MGQVYILDAFVGALVMWNLPFVSAIKPRGRLCPQSWAVQSLQTLPFCFLLPRGYPITCSLYHSVSSAPGVVQSPSGSAILFPPPLGLSNHYSLCHSVSSSLRIVQSPFASDFLFPTLSPTKVWVAATTMEEILFPRRLVQDILIQLHNVITIK